MYNPALMKNTAFDLVIFDCDGVLVGAAPFAAMMELKTILQTAM